MLHIIIHFNFVKTAIDHKHYIINSDRAFSQISRYYYFPFINLVRVWAGVA